MEPYIVLMSSYSHLSEESSPAGIKLPALKAATKSHKKRKTGNKEEEVDNRGAGVTPAHCGSHVGFVLRAMQFIPNRRGQQWRWEGARVKTKSQEKESEAIFSPAVSAGEGKWGDGTECWWRWTLWMKRVQLRSTRYTAVLFKRLGSNTLFYFEGKRKGTWSKSHFSTCCCIWWIVLNNHMFIVHAEVNFCVWYCVFCNCWLVGGMWRDLQVGRSLTSFSTGSSFAIFIFFWSGGPGLL